MPTSRRDLCLSLSAFAALSQLAEATASAQETGSTARGTAALRNNAIFRASQLPVTKSAAGSSQPVTRGMLPTGESVELHNSTLLPGKEPHPPHRHEHEEFLFLREGTVSWLIDGKPQPAEAGDILYAASNVLHGLRNTGTTTARYFVLAIVPNHTPS